MALIVNGRKITDEQLWDEMENLKASTPTPPNCCEQDDEFMGYAKDNMIARALLLEVAQEKNLAVAENRVDTAFDQIVQEAGGKEHFYINYNTSESEEGDFKQDLHDNLLMQDVIQTQLGAKHKPDGEQLKAYYEQHLDRYMRSGQVRASHILKSLDHGADAQAAYRELLEVRQQLKDGGDFASLAKKHSDNPGDPTDEDGEAEAGDLGFFSQGELVPEFEAVAFSLEIGEVSPIFVTPFGYHLVVVKDRKASEPIPLDEIREQVIEHYVEETHNQRVRDYIEQLKKNATIEEIEEQVSWTNEHEHMHEPEQTDDQTDASKSESRIITDI